MSWIVSIPSRNVHRWGFVFELRSWLELLVIWNPFGEIVVVDWIWVVYLMGPDCKEVCSFMVFDFGLFWGWFWLKVKICFGRNVRGRTKSLMAAHLLGKFEFLLLETQVYILSICLLFKSEQFIDMCLWNLIYARNHMSLK